MHRGEARVAIEGRTHLDHCRASGRGAILLTAHLGNWELGAATVKRLGFPVTVVARSHPDRRTDALFVRQRQRCGLAVLPLDQGVTRRALQALAGGQFLGMLGDLDFTGNGLPVPFGDGCLMIPRGPALLSLRSGAPILPAFLIREARNVFRLWIEPPMTAERGAQRESALHALVRQSGCALERYVRRFPEQWVVFNEAVRPAEPSGAQRRWAHEHEGPLLRGHSGR
jgi:KDO2-lipid IV(A) lauroyltransferase